MKWNRLPISENDNLKKYVICMIILVQIPVVEYNNNNNNNHHVITDL